MTAFYNEHDRYAAQYLRNLIAAGSIAPGVVDERDIQEIEAWELIGYTQVHMFAGIGIWSGALRAAGWPDDEPIWTGSCPCQPFSNAGQKKGFSDDRHLWPFWHSLIAQCRPSRIVGEQVTSKDGKIWLDIVSADMEALGFAFGAADLCAAGFGGAHIRPREYFVGLGKSDQSRLFAGEQGGPFTRHGNSFDAASAVSGLGNALLNGNGTVPGNHNNPEKEIIRNNGDSSRPGIAGKPTGAISGLADDDNARLQGRAGMPECGNQLPVGPGSLAGGLEYRPSNGWLERRPESSERSIVGGRGASGMGNAANGDGRRGECGAQAGIGPDEERGRGFAGTNPRDANPSIRREGKTLSGYWHDVDWLLCRNPAGKPSWRPVESGTFPLAHGVADRMGKLRAYGNALDFETAKGFCEILVEICIGL